MNNRPLTTRRLLTATLLAAITMAGCTPQPLTPISANDPEMKALDADRAKYREKKVALIEKALNLSPSEHDAFWREYYAYEAELKALDADRAKYREKKVALIEKALNLSPSEHDAFWREYYAYEAELKKIYDQRYSIIRDYAANYDNMNEDIADNLALRSLKIRDDRNDLFRKYYNRIKKATSSLIAGQFLQIENELNLLSDLKISTETPILPRDVSPATVMKK